MASAAARLAIGYGPFDGRVFNPATESWQLVDAQHAAIVRDADAGQILSMSKVITQYFGDQDPSITFDYGSYEHAMVSGARGGTTENLLFDQGLMRTPVLQLRQATWFASVARRWGMSGHFVIGYPIITDGWTHHQQVFWTKISLVVLSVVGGVLMGVGFLVLRKRSRRISVQTETK